MRVKPCQTAADAERQGFRRTRVEADARVICPAVFAAQVGIAAGEKIHIVERREFMIFRHGGAQHDIACARQQGIGKEGRNHRRPRIAEHIFADYRRQAYAVGRLPFGRRRGRQFDTAFVIADDALVALLKYDLLVLAAHEMLMCGETERENPAFRRIVCAVEASEEGIDAASRARHIDAVAFGDFAAVVVGHPRMDISAAQAETQFLATAIPREDAAEGVFALTVLEITLVAVVSREHRQLSV